MNLLRRLCFVVRATRAGQGEALDRAFSDLQQRSPLSQAPARFPLWMPAQAWKNAASILNVAPPVSKWAAICTGRQAPVSAVKLAKAASDRYEVLFYQTESTDELAAFLKGAGPLPMTRGGIPRPPWRCQALAYRWLRSAAPLPIFLPPCRPPASGFVKGCCSIPATQC